MHGKICRNCGELKHIDEFHVKGIWGNRRNSYCKECDRMLARQRRAEASDAPRYTTPWRCEVPGCGLYLVSESALRWHLEHFHTPAKRLDMSQYGRKR